ncbi:hypothetical protein C8R43DRAFT_1114643 [Mycena crocata]|nr:hypothetical protein C8R43DRAFT_1114643 [Mycena crocata]
MCFEGMHVIRRRDRLRLSSARHGAHDEKGNRRVEGGFGAARPRGKEAKERGGRGRGRVEVGAARRKVDKQRRGTLCPSRTDASRTTEPRGGRSVPVGRALVGRKGRRVDVFPHRLVSLKSRIGIGLWSPELERKRVTNMIHYHYNASDLKTPSRLLAIASVASSATAGGTSIRFAFRYDAVVRWPGEEGKNKEGRKKLEDGCSE